MSVNPNTLLSHLHLIRILNITTKFTQKMKAELIIPIDKLRGKLRQDGFYFRLYKGIQIVQRCPTKWKDTPARKAARQKFAQTWGQRYKKLSNDNH